MISEGIVMLDESLPVLHGVYKLPCYLSIELSDNNFSVLLHEVAAEDGLHPLSGTVAVSALETDETLVPR